MLPKTVACNYRYSPDSEETQLVVPQNGKADVLKEYHDSPTASHYGSDGTFYRITKRYYWVGMRNEVVDHVKSCSECRRDEASNQKLSELLQTPEYAQHFETIN